MDAEIVGRARNELQRQGYHAALLSDPASVTWLTGYAAPAETGPSPFDAPAFVVLTQDILALIVAETEHMAASSTSVPVHTYVGYTIEQPLAPVLRASDSVSELLHQAIGRTGTLLCEAQTLPFHTAHMLHSRYQLVAIDGWANRLRAVKTVSEVNKIRAALELCDLAQTTARRIVRPGASEVALFQEVRAVIEGTAGERLPIFADFIAGQRTVEIGGPPSASILQPNDPLLVDWVLRRNGYWGDNCNVHIAGTPSASLHQLYRTVQQVLDRVLVALKPGMRANELDRLTRTYVERAGYASYPHHTGHGIGVSYHEEPRIVAYNDMILEPGMVIALEPGIYVPGIGGVRLEDTVLITEHGCEVLTYHRKSLE